MHVFNINKIKTSISFGKLKFLIYKEGYASGKYTKPEDTARKLLSILEENTFVSGARIKYSK